MAAQAVWCRYAGEIASDLSQYHHRRIADWHTGVMCSHELLELCEFMPDEGRFKTALRNGEPSDDQWAWRQSANETAILRAGMVPGTNSQDWGSRLFLPRAKIDEADDWATQSAEGREILFAMVDDGDDTSLDDDWRVLQLPST
jgi:hypothetical protein